MKISITNPDIKESARNAVIAELFCEYVRSMEDKPRHTAAVETEIDMFDQFCVNALPDNVELQSELYDKMLNVAVEFEESGFIAGFKTAMQMFFVNEKRVARWLKLSKGMRFKR